MTATPAPTPYATVQDALSVVGASDLLAILRLCEDDYADDAAREAAVTASDVLATALTDAASEIDGRLAVRWKVPLAGAAVAALRHAAIWTAIGRLTRGDTATDEIRRHIRAARQLVATYADGRAQLPAPAARTRQGSAVTVATTPRPWSPARTQGIF